MRFEGSQVKAPPPSRRRMTPPTPLQNSYSSFEEEQEHFEVEDQIWSARDRTVIARTKQYLEESKSSKVEVEELESSLGTEHSDVDFRRILEEARNKKGCAIFETFSSDGPSEFLVEWNTMGRAPKEAECAEGGIEESAACVAAKLVFFNEWKTVACGPGRAAYCLELIGKKGDRAGSYLARCADKRVDMEALAAMFSSSSTHKRKRTISWQAEGVGWSTKERG